MSEPRFCYQHPTTIARRKCFQCRRPLCPKCQIKLDHHLFCTELCHKNYQAELAAHRPKPYARYALYASSIIIFAGVVYFALFADAFYNSGTQTPKTPLNAMTPALPVTFGEKPPEGILITTPLNGMKSASQTILIEGKAPKDSIVGLYLNGTLMISTVAINSQYRFPDVLLTKHANVLQTRYYTNQGSSNFSPAIMVFYQDALQKGPEDARYFQNSPDNISRGNLNRKEIVLTFDGGSTADSCENILDTLKQYHIHSTIFLTGEFIKTYPELTRRIADEQEVGNHTFSHEHLTTYAENYKQNTAPNITQAELQDQLRKTGDLFVETTGKQMSPLWRAPYGEHNLEIRKWAAEIGYTHVAWTSDPRTHQNMDSLDWVPNGSTPGYFPAALIRDRLLSFGQNETEQANGAIMLMHLGTERKDEDRLDRYLPELIKTFQQRGYKFIPASELIDHQDLLPEIAQKK